jgi:hypothetical protein
VTAIGVALSLLNVSAADPGAVAATNPPTGKIAIEIAQKTGDCSPAVGMAADNASFAVDVDGYSYHEYEQNYCALAILIHKPQNLRLHMSNATYHFTGTTDYFPEWNDDWVAWQTGYAVSGDKNAQPAMRKLPAPQFALRPDNDWPALFDAAPVDRVDRELGCGATPEYLIVATSVVWWGPSNTSAASFGLDRAPTTFDLTWSEC